MPILGIIQWVGYFLFSGPFWEYLNSLLWILWMTDMIYIAKTLVSLYRCVIETLGRIF